MKRLIPLLAVVASVAVLALAPLPADAQIAGQAGANVYTIAKYPVDASAANAVAAKRDATTEGRKAAFRSLLKRLVPASSYPLIGQLIKLDPEPYIGGIRVRSEENSSTQYIASLDFSFEADSIRGLLSQHGVPFVDRQAPPSSLMLLYKPPSGGAPAMAGAAGAAAWSRVWQDLDLANALAPLRLVERPADLTLELRQALLNADAQTLAEQGARFATSQLVVAEAEPLPQTRELQVTLAGQDAAGRFSVTTRYGLDDEDFLYSLELAAVIAQGVLEGRWKAVEGGDEAAASALGGPAVTLTVLAEFSNLGQWQRQQQVLAGTPGVRNLYVDSLSGRSASISLSYPGGGQALQAALSRQGMMLENINGFWVLR